MHAPEELSPETVTELLGRARGGDASASNELFDRVYAELKRLAHAQLSLRGRVGATIETTALVHEAYLRLVAPSGMNATDRAHFFNLAARVMRNVLVDVSRRREADKRGGGLVRVELDDANSPVVDEADLGIDVLALDRALGALERDRPKLAQLVELRFFAGLSFSEIAPILGRHERTLKSDWRRARAYLLVELGAADAAAGPADE